MSRDLVTLDMDTQRQVHVVMPVRIEEVWGKNEKMYEDRGVELEPVDVAPRSFFIDV